MESHDADHNAIDVLLARVSAKYPEQLSSWRKIEKNCWQFTTFRQYNERQ
ncbi:MAG: hypothetical protein ACTS73_08495 [Arsenophonus sp. NEOnobi-MAG3]